MMDNYTMIGLIVGCAVGGALFLIIVIIVCLVLREGWLESKRRKRINRYRATSPDGSYYPPPSNRGDAIGIAYNDPSMYAADVRPVRPESLWRRSIRRVQSAFGLPSALPGGGGGGRASAHAHGSGKGLYHSPLNSNSSGSSKKQMLSPADEVELRYPPAQPPHQHGSVGSRHSAGRTEPSAAGATTALPRTALPTVADVGGGYSNMAAPYSERYYALLRPAGVLADGQALYFCRTQDYYDLSDCFDIVGKKDGGWLVKPADGMPPPPPSFASIHRPRGTAEPSALGRPYPSAANDDSDRRRYASAYSLTGRAAADTDRRRFASDYDLHRSGALTGSGLTGGYGAAARPAPNQRSNGARAANAPHGISSRRGEQAAVIATPFGPARRVNDQYLSGTALAATAAAAAAAVDSPDGEFEGAHTPPPLPKHDYRPAKPPRAMLTEVTVEVDGVGGGGGVTPRRQTAKEQPEAGVHNAQAAAAAGLKREIGLGIVATPVVATAPAAVTPAQPPGSGGASGRRSSPAATMAVAVDGASSSAAVEAQPPLSARSAKDSDSYGKRRGKRTPSSKSSSGGRGGGGGSSRKGAASQESPVLVSARVLHDSNASLAAAAAAARDPPAGGQSQQQPQRLQRPSSFADLSGAGLQIPKAELEVAIAVAPPTPPPPPLPLPSEDAGVSARGAGSEPQQGRGLSQKSAAILAAMPELDTVGSKDTVSTIKSYSRHIAEEFKFLDKYEGSTGTPEPL